MKKIIGIILLSIILGGGCERDSSPTGPSSGTNPTGPSGTAVVKDQTDVIRIGYHSPSLINGQVGEVFVRTNVLQKNGLKGEVNGFSDETSMLESMEKGNLDLMVVSDFKAMVSLGNGFDGLIVGTLGTIGRNGLIVSADSTVKEIKDLANKKIGVEFNSSGHRDLLTWLQRDGLTPGGNVILIDTKGAAQITALQNKLVDAIVLTDPELEKYYRLGYQIRADDRNYSVVLLKRDYWQKNPQATRNVVLALKETLFFISRNQNKGPVNNWFAAASAIQSDLIWACSATNHHYNSNKEINEFDITLTDAYLQKLQNSANFVQSQKIGTPPDLSKVIEPALKQVVTQLQVPLPYQPESVQIIVK
ncbi:MAG: ABC transporter substrate-binding protein [Planctomycetota bacterium]